MVIFWKVAFIRKHLSILASQCRQYVWLMLISSKMVKEYETAVILGARSNLQIVFAVLVRLTLVLTDGVKVTGLAVSYRDGFLTAVLHKSSR